MKFQKRNTIPLRHKKHNVTHAFACAVYSGLGGKLARSLLNCLEKGDHRSIIEAEINPSDYSSMDDFRDDYLACELMSKFPSWELGINRETVAIEKFRSSEQACRETNQRLLRLEPGSLTTPGSASFIWTARRKIESLLGPFDWDEARKYFGWGPGATFSLPRSRSDALYKFGEKPTVTSSCAMLAACCIVQVPTWLRSLTGMSPAEAELSMSDVVNRAFTIVPGNRITTVPKNSKTDRVIAIEPCMNGYIQKGIGGVIRRRLRKVGVDLKNQGLNQVLSREGSLTGLLATMDLSAASDSVSMELVEALLPPDWVLAIKLSRSPEGVLPDGTRVAYQKVSSMGNGFTFELESLIFWALVASVMELSPRGLDHRIGVYGDDLIFPVHLFSDVEELLKVCGFAVNRKKSFCYGYFRESCGKHYFHGTDVTPIYVREDIVDVDALLLQANNLRRYASRGQIYGLRKELLPAYELLVRSLPRPLQKPRIPDGYGDTALFGDWDEVRPSKALNGHEGWRCDSYRLATSRVPLSSSIDAPILKSLSRLEGSQWTCNPLVKKVARLGDGNIADHFTADERFERLDLGDPLLQVVEKRYLVPHKLQVKQWRNFGPWV